ncbi:MAG: peptidoglycan-binding protein, partial [Pseudomonadota bacterium]
RRLTDPNRDTALSLANKLFRDGIDAFGTQAAYCAPAATADAAVYGSNAEAGDATRSRDAGGAQAVLDTSSGARDLDPALLAYSGSLCPPGSRGPCETTLTAQEQEALSRYALQQCKSFMAIGAVGKARIYCERAIEFGRRFGAQSATEAAQLLQAMALTCNYDEASLSRISKYFATLQPKGQLIETADLQKALKALGHYSGEVDGKVGQQTITAVREFQRSLGFPEASVLTPRQTVTLICSAAQTARDIDSQNLLGIMYALGLGVVQNTALALDWLDVAAVRGDGDAAFNLALLYGTQIVWTGYTTCPVAAETNRDVGDAYLRQAARRGHPRASDFQSRFGGLDPADRWRRIAIELQPTTLGTGLSAAC